jgi:hypothetical protein
MLVIMMFLRAVHQAEAASASSFPAVSPATLHHLSTADHKELDALLMSLLHIDPSDVSTSSTASATDPIALSTVSPKSATVGRRNGGDMDDLMVAVARMHPTRSPVPTPAMVSIASPQAMTTSTATTAAPGGWTGMWWWWWSVCTCV